MSVTLALTLLAVFISVALLAGSVTSVVLNGQGTRKRLLQVTRAAEMTVLPGLMPLSGQELTGIWADVARYLPRSKKEMKKLQLRMVRAGIRHPGAAVIYSLVEIVGPVVMLAAAFLLFKGPVALVAAMLGAGLTFFAPSLTLGQRLASRRREIENGLPDMLDLLVVCIEAGSGIDQALVKTGDEIAIAYPALGDELRILTMEIRAGKPRLEAFKAFAQRTKVDDVRALVAMLIQTDRFGTSIGQALRTHADTSRTKRRQRAEEKAQKIGVKLVFPLVLFFFPAFYIVVLGPAVIQFIRQFMQP